MCGYCQDGELIDYRALGKYSDAYTGFDISINGNILSIVCCVEIGSFSQGTTYAEKDIEIKYCPMCGGELAKNVSSEVYL